MLTWFLCVNLLIFSLSMFLSLSSPLYGTMHIGKSGNDDDGGEGCVVIGAQIMFIVMRMRKVPWWTFGWEAHWKGEGVEKSVHIALFAERQHIVQLTPTRTELPPPERAHWPVSFLFVQLLQVPSQKSAGDVTLVMKSLFWAVSVWRTLSYQRPKASLAGWTPGVLPVCDFIVFLLRYMAVGLSRDKLIHTKCRSKNLPVDAESEKNNIFAQTDD